MSDLSDDAASSIPEEFKAVMREEMAAGLGQMSQLMDTVMKKLEIETEAVTAAAPATSARDDEDEPPTTVAVAVVPFDDDAEDEEEEVNDAPVPNPRRYFNQQLRPFYDRVPFPVRQPFPATPAAVHNTQYTRTLHRNGTNANASTTRHRPRVRWCHSVRTPNAPPPNPLFGNSFLPLLGLPADDPGGGGGDDDGSNKKAKNNAEGSKDATAAPSRSKARKKPVQKEKPPSKGKQTFTRKMALEGVLRTYKIRMWPNEAQTKELKRLFAASRTVKNWVNAELKQGRMVPDNRTPGAFLRLQPSKIGLRNHFRANGRAGLPDWAKDDLDGTVHVNACFDVANAYTSAKALQQAGHITHFDVKFWSSTVKTPTEVVKVNKKVRPNGKGQEASLFDKTTPFTPDTPRSAKHAECLLHLNKGFKPLGGIRMQDKKPVIEKLLAEGRMLKEDCKIRWDKRARSFHFIYTYDMPVPADPDPTWATKRVTANDGGIRGFNTFCNATTGAYGELVCGFQARIHDRVEKIDDLDSRCVLKRQGQGVRPEDKQKKSRARRRHDRVNARERRRRRGQCPPRKPAKDKRLTRLNRKLRRDRVRQTRWVEAVHYDAIGHLLNSTDVVINPVLRTSSMVPREGRVFGAKSARAMLTMSHYKFNQRLKSAAVRFPGRHVFDDTGEPGTTRTCANPNCGRWHANLGGDHVFTCPQCTVSLGRDDNGARGNLLAALGKALGVPADATSNH